MSEGQAIRIIFKDFIDNKPPGPKSNIFVFYFEQAIRLIAEGDVDRKNKLIGRQKLANDLGLGGGSIRSLLKTLKKEELIKTSKLGNQLTKKGEKFLKELRKEIPFSEIQINSARELTNSDYNFALILRNYIEKIGTGMAQRDAAMKIGASGAITIIFKDGKYSIPEIQNFKDLKTQYPKIIEELNVNFNIEPNDIIIIATANDSISVKKGVWAAAYSLI